MRLTSSPRALHGTARYAQLQIIAQAVEATGGFDDARLAAYTRSTTFDTVMGSVTFGVNGEWAEPRVSEVQFQGISGHEVGQFQSGSRQIVVTPPNFASGEFSFPCAVVHSPE
jgi:branched-chain amino acid transport system substrate-binding protein